SKNQFLREIFINILFYQPNHRQLPAWMMAMPPPAHQQPPPPAHQQRVSFWTGPPIRQQIAYRPSPPLNYPPPAAEAQWLDATQRRRRSPSPHPLVRNRLASPPAATS